MTIEMIFTKEEIKENIPYEIICLVRYGSIWNTMKRKIRWDNEFSNDEREEAERIFRQTYNWFVKGIPDNVRMDFSTYKLCEKIARFCYSL